MDLPESLKFIRGKVWNLEGRSRDTLLAICPKCGKKELRIWERDVEARCASCSWWTFGEEDFIQRLKDIGRQIVTLPPKTDLNGEERKAQAEGQQHMTLTSPKKK